LDGGPRGVGDCFVDEVFVFFVCDVAREKNLCFISIDTEAGGLGEGVDGGESGGDGVDVVGSKHEIISSSFLM
jgi:hypothetical protein